jgi:glutamate synthase domain-containing protein 2
MGGERAERIYNLLRVWTLELKDVLGALGINTIESLRGNRERLRGLGLDQSNLEALGIQPAGR